MSRGRQFGDGGRGELAYGPLDLSAVARLSGFGSATQSHRSVTDRKMQRKTEPSKPLNDRAFQLIVTELLKLAGQAASE